MAAGLLRVFHGFLDRSPGVLVVGGKNDLSLGCRKTVDDGCGDENDGCDQIGSVFPEKRSYIHSVQN